MSLIGGDSSRGSDRSREACARGAERPEAPIVAALLELVIFDNDGVLVDSEPISNRVLAQALTEAGLPTTTAESMDAFMGRRWEDSLGRSRRATNARCRPASATPTAPAATRRSRPSSSPSPGSRRRSRGSRSSAASPPAARRRRSASPSSAPGCWSCSRAGSSPPTRSSAASRRRTCSCTPRSGWGSSRRAARWSRTRSSGSRRPDRRRDGGVRLPRPLRPPRRSRRPARGRSSRWPRCRGCSGPGTNL